MRDLKNPLVSIIVPCYNVENSIEKLIDELLMQTYKELEILCIDDGSTDSTLSVLKSLTLKDDRLRVFSQENSGVSSARNKGLEACNGQYITFADSDDYVKPNFISYLYSLLVNNDCQLSVCSYEIQDSNGTVLDRKLYYDTVDKDTYYSQKTAIIELTKYYGKICGHVWDKMFIRKYVDELRFDNDISNCEDTLFVFKYLKKCNRIVLGPSQEYIYVQHPNSMLHREYTEGFFSGILAWERMYKLLDDEQLKELYKSKISKDIILHEKRAIKSLPISRQKKFRNIFLKYTKQYKDYKSYKDIIIGKILYIYFWVI